VLRVTALVAGVFLALRLLWTVRTVACLTFLGVLFGVTLAGSVDRLARWRIPRAVGAPAILLAILAAFAGVGALTAPRIAGQLRELRSQLPEAVRRIERGVERWRGDVASVLQPPQDADRQPSERKAPPKIEEGVGQQMGKVLGHFFAFFSSTLAVLGSLILLLVVMLYIAIDPDLYRRGLMHLFPHRSRARAGEVLSAMALTLRRWLATQLIAMLVIGVVTTVVLLLLQVRAAVALGIIAGILEFIPYVGPIFSAVPAMAMALLDGPEKALWVALAYIGIQQAENHLLIPLLMQEGIEVPPVLTIVVQAAMALVLGFIGLLVAVPLLGAIMVPIKMLYVEDVVGDEVALPGEPGG
jgi:predicted PurR-regulated permease PerM